MAGGRKKAAPATPEHQEVESGEEGEETEVEDQQDSTVFLHQRVDNLDTKINKVLAALGKLTTASSAPGILQEAADAQSTQGSVSGESISSESALPVYSDDRLALVVEEGSKSVKPSDRHKANLLSSVSRTILLLQSRTTSKLSPRSRRGVD